MQIVVRDLTIANGAADVCADISGDVMTLQLNPDHEYMVVDHDSTLDPSEFDPIETVREVLRAAKEADLTEENLKVLSKTYLFSEIVEFAKYGFEDIEILDFDAITNNWNNGHGVCATEDNLGRVMYEEIGFNGFGCEIPEQLVDHIDFSANWHTAESDGYRHVRVKCRDFIVRCAA